LRYKGEKDERLGFRQDYIGGSYDALQTPNPVIDFTTAERNVVGAGWRGMRIGQGGYSSL